MTAPRAREQADPPAPPDRRPSPRGGQPSYKTESAAARRAFLRSARTLAAAACLAFSGALALPPTAEAQTDTTPPTLSRAFVERSGTSITVIFSEELDLYEQYLSDAVIGAFTVTADDVELEVGSGQVGLLEDLVIVLSTTIYPGQTVVVSYNQSVAGSDALADAAGNEVVDFTTGSGGVPAVVNSSTQVAIPPGLEVTLQLSDDANLEGDTVTVTATVSPASPVAFTVAISATPVAPATADDFTLSTNRVLRFAADATESTGTVTITAVRRRHPRAHTTSCGCPAPCRTRPSRTRTT